MARSSWVLRIALPFVPIVAPVLAIACVLALPATAGASPRPAAPPNGGAVPSTARADEPICRSTLVLPADGARDVPVVIDTWVRGDLEAHGCVRRHWRCGTGDMALFALVAFVFVVVLVTLAVVGVVRSIRRAAARDSATPVAISLLVVEQVARALQRRGGVVAAIGLAGVPGMLVMGHELGAIPMTIIACVGIRGYVIARSVLRRLEGGAGDVTAEVRGATVYVREAELETQFDVPPRILARARNHAVPAATTGACPRAAAPPKGGAVRSIAKRS